MPLIVKLVLIASSGIPSKRISASASVSMRDADAADLLLDVGVVGVVAALGRQVERDRQPGAALREQVAVALVRLLGGAEARVLADRPQPAAVAVGEVAAGERELARRRDRLRAAGGPSGPVDGRERDARPRCARHCVDPCRAVPEIAISGKS